MKKLTPEVIATILSLVRDCVPVSTAARSAGISYTTLKAWRARGRSEPDSIFGEFSAAIDEAVSEAEIAMVRSVHGASRSDPKAAQWMLERRFGGRWSPKTKQDIKAKVEHSSKLDVSKLSQAERDALRSILTKATNG